MEVRLLGDLKLIFGSFDPKIAKITPRLTPESGVFASRNTLEMRIGHISKNWEEPYLFGTEAEADSI